MSKKFASALFGLASTVLLASPAPAAITENVIVPWTQDTFVPCAAGGQGELVAVSGRLHISSTATTDRAGGEHMTFHFNPLRMTGVGWDTDDTYRVTGVTRGSVTVAADGFPYAETFVHRFHMIGRAGAVNFKLHITFHVTLDANGELAAEIDSTSVTCS